MGDLRGSALDEAIAVELELIKAEGNVEEITPILVHKRLVAKGLITGQVSTLTPRKEMIEEANAEYLSGLGFTKREMEHFKSRNNKLAFKESIKRLQDEKKELADQLATNTYTMISIIRLIKTNTTIPIEAILTPYLVKELRDAESMEEDDVE
ncbi:hypothetical protein L4D08_24460 [Photobacterium chitinilyticum]|uniref:hypothetical protein n=1 Tax=Photobacterium chitinilyticum TaxID=2485123 RepID=UPI003D0B5A25